MKRRGLIAGLLLSLAPAAVSAQLLMTGVGGIAPASTGSFSIYKTFLTSATVQATPYTFTAADLGTAGASRQVVVALVSGGAASLTGVITVGAQACTQDMADGSSTRIFTFCHALVPTGTTGDIVFTPTGTANGVGLVYWVIPSTSNTAPTAKSGTAPDVNPSGTTVTTASSVALTAGGTLFIVGRIGASSLGSAQTLTTTPGVTVNLRQAATFTGSSTVQIMAGDVSDATSSPYTCTATWTGVPAGNVQVGCLAWEP